MRIGIDISQLAYKNTGVANYLWNLVCALVKENKDIQFVLFFSSLRGSIKYDVSSINYNNVEIKAFRIPPSLLDVLWNKLHIMSIEKFIGNVDFFISSDWAEPPAKRAKKGTIIYDLIVYKFPEETHSKTEIKLKGINISSNIVDIQKKKLSWVKKESDVIFCISDSTKKDAVEILGLDEKKVRVIYPGVNKLTKSS